jgi:hypothetical protein
MGICSSNLSIPVWNGELNNDYYKWIINELTIHMPTSKSNKNINKFLIMQKIFKSFILHNKNKINDEEQFIITTINACILYGKALIIVKSQSYMCNLLYSQLKIIIEQINLITLNSANNLILLETSKNKLYNFVLEYFAYFEYPDLINLIPADYAKNFTITMLNDIQNSLRTYSK